MPMLEAALSYAARGWRIFPAHSVIFENGIARCTCGKADCRDIAKHPRIKAWQKTASAERQTVERWWGRWPDANIAVVCGGTRPGEPGLVVGDVDSQEGLDQLRGLCATHGPLGETLTAQSGRQGVGLHFYFQGELAGTRTVGKILFRGARGYVIAPPSRHRTGRLYKWLNPQAKILSWPDWLRDYVNAGVQTADRIEEFSFGARPDYLGPLSRRLSAELYKALVPQPNADELERIKTALAAVPASCDRKTWLEIGMALHSLEWERPDGSNLGFDLWNAWSATCEEKYALHDVETRWASFGKRSGIGIGTLFHYAGEQKTNGEAHLGGGVSGQVGTFEQRLFTNTNSQLVDVNGMPFQGAATAVMHAPIVFPDRRRGKPYSSVPNVRVAMRALDLQCKYDLFHDQAYINGSVIAIYEGAVTDKITTHLRDIIYQRFRLDASNEAVRCAIDQECLAHCYDPVRDYLDELVWDKTPRLEHWLMTYLGAEDTSFNRAVARLSLVAAVRRVRSPGCKFDQIIVLEGPEGVGKSSALQILAGAAENFSDQPILGRTDQQQQEAVTGIWIYEIAELQGMRRTEAEHTKAFASRTVDRARPAYGHRREDRPRRCIFFGTGNESEYSRSMTGDRRIWPISTNRIDLAALTRDRDQLWAEAVYHEAQGMSLELPRELWKIAAAEQEARRITDPWEDYLMDLGSDTRGKNFIDKTDGQIRIATCDVLTYVLNIPSERQQDHQIKRLAQVMRKLEWYGPKKLRVKGKSQRGFWKPEHGTPGTESC